MRDLSKSTRFAGLVLLLGVAATASAWAQDPRDAQVARAFHEFDATRRQQMLMSVLNPIYGPPRGAWPVGVQLLAQTLLEEGKDSAAALWLRWAIRVSPEMQPDTVLFLPELVGAFRSAQDYVRGTTGPADSLAATTWLWSPQTASDQAGRLQIAGAETQSIRVAVRGVGRIVPGGSIPFKPGSYQIGAIASGYDSVQVTREVLPGVTTLVEFQLRTSPAKVATRGQPRPRVRPAEGVQARQPQQPPSRRKKKGFPVVLAGLGAVGAVAIAAVLVSNGGQPEPTGSVTVTIPSSP